MSDIYKEFGVDVFRDCCSENEGPTATEMKMAQEIKRLRARVAELEYAYSKCLAAVGGVQQDAGPP